MALRAGGGTGLRPSIDGFSSHLREPTDSAFKLGGLFCFGLTCTSAVLTLHTGDGDWYGRGVGSEDMERSRATFLRSPEPGPQRDWVR